MPFVANDGHQIWYELNGRGDGVGALSPQTKVSWCRTGHVDALASRGEVVVVDPRGYGLSSRSRRGDDYGAELTASPLSRVAAWTRSSISQLQPLIVYGDGDDLIRQSVAASRDRLVARASPSASCRGLDHQSCVEAASNVVVAVDGALEETSIRGPGE